MRLVYIDGQLHQVEKLPSPLPVGTLLKHSDNGLWHRKEKRRQ